MPVRKIVFRKWMLSLFVLLSTECLLAQSSKDPLITYLDYLLQPSENPERGYSYAETKWKENGKWHAQLYMMPEKVLIADYWYADDTRDYKEGIYLAFHDNGQLKDSGHYVAGKKYGKYFSWYKNGEPAAEYQYLNGIPIDTCVRWNTEGRIVWISVTDSLGNGIGQAHYGSGKVKEKGRLLYGLRQGVWQVKDEAGTKIMEVEFQEDSAIRAYCFAPDGQALKGNCIYEKQPEFPGGLDGWRKFLERNLNYPADALSANITGVVKVKFHIAADGTLSEYEIVSSPHPSLSSEVLRLMRKSPKWEPALQYNKPVMYRHVQSVTFMLE